MRSIALINQKGGVGKTTTAANLGACLAEAGKRVLLVDLDPQANLTLHLGQEPGPEDPSSYGVLIGRDRFADAVRPTALPRLSIVGTTIDLSGAELELATALGRETLLRDAMEEWRGAYRALHGGGEPVDYVLFDCPPSLGLLSINALTAAEEVCLVVQTEFFALQGMSKLLELVGLVQRRLHRGLRVSGIVACLYDTRLKLAREVLAELRRHFPEQIFRTAIGTNVKLAEAPSFGQTILEYAPESNGARDYRSLAGEVIAQEAAPASPRAREGGPAAAEEATQGAPEAAERPREARAQAQPVSAPEAGGSLPAPGESPGESPAAPDELRPRPRPPEPRPADRSEALESAARAPEHD